MSRAPVHRRDHSQLSYGSPCCPSPSHAPDARVPTPATCPRKGFALPVSLHPRRLGQRPHTHPTNLQSSSALFTGSPAGTFVRPTLRRRHPLDRLHFTRHVPARPLVRRHVPRSPPHGHQPQTRVTAIQSTTAGFSSCAPLSPTASRLTYARTPSQLPRWSHASRPALPGVGQQLIRWRPPDELLAIATS